MTKTLKNPKIKNQNILWVVIILLIAGNVFTLFWFERKPSGDMCSNNYSFINPQYRCNEVNVVNKKEYNGLKTKLEQFISQKKSGGKVNLVGIWFRDLKSGPTFGINSEIDFIPASLLKLPLALTFFDLAKDDPGILQKVITDSGPIAEVPTQEFKPRDPIQPGMSYTVEQLIAHALSHSDNVAAQLLYQYLEDNYKGQNPILETYRELGILQPGSDLNKEAVNPKEYSAIFRQLYNASFLDKDASDKLLSFMAQSEFQDGLRRGVPDSIVIAHKFGERFLENGEKQLHDCGIIYYPGNRYQLCIMTRGNNYDDLKDIIGEISKDVYQEFDSRRLSHAK